jgi:hypothetical protein
MKIRAYYICPLILLAFSGQTGLAQAPRDMARYDDGGAFDFRWDAGLKAHALMNGKLRDFLWEHWTQKRLAHVVVTLYTIEGDPTTYNLFIEPDGSQRWRVVAEYESECCWSYALEKPRRKRTRKKGVALYDVVERVQISGNDQGTLPVIPGGDRRESNSYVLQLRRTDGNNLRESLIF